MNVVVLSDYLPEDNHMFTMLILRIKIGSLRLNITYLVWIYLSSLVFVDPMISEV